MTTETLTPEYDKMSGHIIYGEPVSEVTLINVNQALGTYLTKACHEYKDNIFMIDAETEKCVTWWNVLEKSERVASLLLNLGCSPGSVVAVICENSLEYPALLMGITNIGAIYTSISALSPANELQKTLDLSKPSIVFTSRKLNKKIRDLQSKCPFLKLIVNLDEIGIAKVVAKYCRNGNDENCIQVNPTSTASIVYTSGTTGLSKAVLLSHKSWIYTLEMFRTEKIIQFPENNVVVGLVPEANLRELTTILICCVLGFKYIRIPLKSEKSIFHYIEKFEISTIMMNPMNAALIATHTDIDDHDLSSVKLLSCGGEFLSDRVEKILEQRFGYNVLNRFGMSETNGTNLFTAPSSRKGITGRLIPGMTAKIVNLENKKTLGPFQEGEYCVKGPSLCNGYLNADINNALDEDGFLHTCDIGYYDPDQNFYIVSRLRDGFTCEGLPVLPRDLETLIGQLPDVAAVAVTGVPDKILGDANASARAYVVKKPGSSITEDEIMDYVACKVSHHKWLHGGVRFVDSLPQTKMEKLDRKSIKQWAVSSIKI